MNRLPNGRKSTNQIWMRNEAWKEGEVLARVAGITLSQAIERIILEWRDIRIPGFSVAQKQEKRVE